MYVCHIKLFKAKVPPSYNSGKFLYYAAADKGGPFHFSNPCPIPAPFFTSLLNIFGHESISCHDELSTENAANIVLKALPYFEKLFYSLFDNNFHKIRKK